jgi:hypothetical protein
LKTATRTHIYVDDPDAPGTCRHCGRADPLRLNQAHQLPDRHAAQSEHRRRAGERENDE